MAVTCKAVVPRLADSNTSNIGCSISRSFASHSLGTVGIDSRLVSDSFSQSQ